MPSARGRASERTLDALHRETAKAILAELKRIKKAKEPVSAALLNAATSLLKVTGTTTPARPANRSDRLKGLLNEFEETEARESGEIDFNVGRIEQPARSFPEE
jgi:hypothetical protein